MGGLHDLAGVRRVNWGGDGGGARDRPADAAARWRHVVQGASQQTVQERVWNGPAIPAQRLPAPESILRARGPLRPCDGVAVGPSPSMVRRPRRWHEPQRHRDAHPSGSPTRRPPRASSASSRRA